MSERKNTAENADNWLWPRVKKSDGCWFWLGSRDQKGYGKVQFQGQKSVVHRVVYELLVGPVPDGFQVCHHCDNPPCCNPAHLFVGTNQDNVRDSFNKGRREGYDLAHYLQCNPQKRQVRRKKLTAAQVAIIRSRAASLNICQAELARAFGVTPNTIMRAVHGKTWRNL